MKRAYCIIGTLLCLVLLSTAQFSVASEHGHEQVTKEGILLVAFGSSVPEAQVSFEKIDQSARLAFPDTEIRWAFTSHIIRNKLNKQGKDLQSPIQALAAMANEGFTHVAVQSLHSIPGEEYSDLLEICKRFEGMPDGIQQIEVGRPLLFSAEDIDKAADAMIQQFPKNRKPNEAIVLMGHGTPHPGNVYYSALQQVFDLKVHGVFVGTVEGWPELSEVESQLKAGGFSKVILMPFMSVAGDHARNDMAGSEDDSWNSILTAHGYKVSSVLHGTAEYNEFRSLWIQHLTDARTALK